MVNNNNNNNIDIKKKSHRDYVITNSEWVYKSGSLSDYMVNEIRAIDYGRISYEVYDSVEEYYVRDEYNVGYTACNSVGGVEDERYILDPWNRRFMLFPYSTSTSETAYGYRYDKYRVSKVGNLKQLVYIISTSINGNSVYCVDWLRDRYIR